jgi:hypothetical protein
MSKEVIFRLRDDLDDSIGDIETLTFEWINGQLYEIDLNATHIADMEQAMLPYVKAARPIKRKARTKQSKPKAKAASNGDKPKRNPQWPAEIHGWATDRGYDWDDVNQRRAVREWARREGMIIARAGVIPQHVMEAHYQARQEGLKWPPEGE